MKKHSLLYFFFLLLPFLSFANNEDIDALIKERIKRSAVNFFEQDELIEITVKADFKEIRADRDRTTNEYHDARLVIDNDADSVEIPVKIKTRGNFRLKSENCDFPPLRFKFKTRNVINTIFEGQDKLKLVTHCRDTSAVMQEAMLREYLVYKMYNEISDNSLRVRLVKVKYLDVNYGEELHKYAFFIETVDQMAERIGAEEINLANLKQDQLIEQSTTQLALFNYLIGNTDWSIPKVHNVALLRTDRHAPPFAVPYDFDMSEFVDACYMKVYMGRELIERRYRGKKVPIETLENVIEHYQEQKDELVNLILGFDYLELEARQECLKLLESFYQVINSKHASRKAFIAEATK